MFQLSFPKTAESIATKRLEEFPDQTTIITSCPFCREGLALDGREVIDLAELLAKACSSETDYF
jgi:Fe-S oxidoreductase